MCGIAGLFNLSAGAPPPIADLARMIAAIRHRGPDGLGIYRDADVGLAHARLAIVDPAGGRQPFAGARERVWATYNGEIYNHVELRAELEARGRRFFTRCDTEVLVAAYEVWGDACVERFEGQFAFALFDVPRRRLVLARDRFGVRPLYYTRAGGRLAFASEVKSLFELSEVRRAIDPLGLDEIFTFWTPLAPRTAFAGIGEIRPGHIATIEPNGALEERAYFTPTFPAHGSIDTHTPIEASAKELGRALTKATELRLHRADVPVGCYLSGGIDSSVVAALARRVHSGKLSTFSIRFEDQELDEGRFQREMVERLETSHEEIVVRRADVAQSFPEVICHVERPILRTAPAPLYLLSERVRNAGFKVVLTGEGADEMLAGYDLFREAKVRRFIAKDPGSRFRQLLVDRLYPWFGRGPREAREMARSFFARDLDTGAALFSHRPRFRAAAALKRLFSPEIRAAIGDHDAEEELCKTLPAEFAEWGPLSRAQYLEIRTLLSGYLLSGQGDRPSMAHSVEGRFPFLDADVFACASRMPESHKLHVLEEKHVLKRLAEGLVPRAILERPKQPYRAPDAVSFLEPDAPDYIHELLAPEALSEAGLFDPIAVARLVAKCRAGAGGRPLANSDNMAFVGVLSAQLVWHELCRTSPEHSETPTMTVIDRLKSSRENGGNDVAS